MSFLTGIEETSNGGSGSYIHPTTTGNKHIPSGGATGNVLRWSDDGTAVWGNDIDTIYSVVSKTASGLAPQLPNDTLTNKYLRQDGTWNIPPNTTYNPASESAQGLVKRMATQADSVSTDVAGLVAEFNTLLAKLKTAGMMTS